jgi:hypothetical protein
MSGSTVPATIDALLALFRAALPDLQITDGPDYDPRNNFLAVGWHSNDEPATAANNTIADAGRSRDQEDYDVFCLLSFHVGSGGVSAARSSLYAAFEVLCAALRGDSALGGAVSRARLSEHAYLPMVDEGGITLSIRFAVNVIAWK